MYIHIFFPSSTGDSTFPALTVCPEYDAAFKGDVLSKYNVSKSNFRRRFTYPKNLTTTLTDFFYDATYSLEEMVEEFYINTNDKLPGTDKSVFWYSNVAKDRSGGKVFSI